MRGPAHPPPATDETEPRSLEEEEEESVTRVNGGPVGSTLVALMVLGLTGLGAGAHAQSVSVEEAEDYLGTWKLTASLQETAVELMLEIIAEEGEVKAALGSAFQPEPQLIETITKTDEGLVLAYDANFGGNALRIEVRAALEAGGLVGSFGDDLGLFSADFTGERAADQAGIVAEATLAAAKAAESPTQPTRRLGSRRVKLALGKGNELRIHHGSMKVGSQDHQSLLDTAAGEVFSYASSRTMKMLTDTDLHFGETRLRAYNLAPNYPGCYALWLKRVEDGWHLVFNTQADMWGTQYDPTTDVAEIPLEVAELETPQEDFLVELTEKEGGGLLRIVWGNSAWSAPFQVE